MLNLNVLRLLAVLSLLATSLFSASESSVNWGDATWTLQLDPATGALVRIENKTDPLHMNWLREAGHWERRQWVTDTSPDASVRGGQWGLVETTHTGLLHAAKVQKIAENIWESVHVTSSLTVTTRRELTAQGLVETYTFKNTGAIALDLPLGSVAISAPLFDQYPKSDVSLTSRCHVHLWMGGSSAWINATRMNTAAPHLGLVVTNGSLDGYSQRGTTLSDRGLFFLHPAAMNIPAGQTRTIAWRLFWHSGWDDFQQTLREQPGFISVSASRYAVAVGEPLEITVQSTDPLSSAKVSANAKPIETQTVGNQLKAAIPTTVPGEITVEVINGSRRTWLRANVTLPLDALIDARVRFIMKHQQRRVDGDPLDGAYLSFDNETGEQVYAAKPSDHNAGRERLGMGVLGALYLTQCRDTSFKAELAESLKRYAAFVSRELEDEEGTVFSTVGRKNSERLYNHPWVAHFHLAMYQATGDTDQLQRAVRNLRSYYAHGGARFYAIGLPISEILTALEKAGLTTERNELLGRFREHADQIIKTGTHYPISEVNFEQSIVAPAVQILLEVYLATKESAYLEEAKKQLPLLTAFAGHQPDHRLNEVSIRHWDDYWFGKARLYGDTFPHYWSTLNGVAFAHYAKATNERSWFDRAQAGIDGNLSLFTADGRGSAAHVYPLTSNGRPGQFNDPWANDQDWVLVHALLIRALAKE